MNNTNMIEYLLKVTSNLIILISYTQVKLALHQGIKGHNATSDAVTNESSTVMEIDIVIQKVWNLLEREIRNRYIPLLQCYNFGDIVVYLICPILGKCQWRVVRDID
jgi:hypothetical protein